MSEYDYEAEYVETREYELRERYRTSHARHVRRVVMTARDALEHVMDEYDVSDTQTATFPGHESDRAVDELDAREVATIVAAHDLTVQMIAHLTHFLKDR